jgi:hypothetical protein
MFEKLKNSSLQRNFHEAVIRTQVEGHKKHSLEKKIIVIHYGKKMVISMFNNSKNLKTCIKV